MSKENEEMNDAEMWKEIRKQKQTASSLRRSTCPEELLKNGITFTSHNNDAHLIVEGPDCYIDYWPGTGKWNARNGHKGFSLSKLIEYCKRNLS